MPKRKRNSSDDGDSNGDRVLKMRMKDVQDRIVQAKKQLHRALKLAKGFERQKLGKRLKNATSSGDTEQVQRINTEIKVLKELDLTRVAESHLYKTLKKVKSFVGSGLLPQQVVSSDGRVEKEGMTEEEITALRNVTSGMYNIKGVKDVMKVTMQGMYLSLGIPMPEERNGKKQVSNSKEGSKNSGPLARSEISNNTNGESESGKEVELDEQNELSWEGFDEEEDEDADSDEEVGSGSESDGDENEVGDDLDEEELAKWDALLGGSSDEESFDEEEYKTSHPDLRPRQSLSLSPSPSPPQSGSEGSDSSDAESSASSSREAKPSKTSKPSRAQPAPKPIGSSTFLPTLMGGYWSGSESASDIEEEQPVRKNRKGQRARRAIWEKKYGGKANHIVKDGGKTKDDGWDPKRGAKDGKDDWRDRKRAKFAERAGGRGRNAASATGENAIAVTPRNRDAGKSAAKRDDVGVLHPSWQAAKKAKEMKKNVSFQGKKVVFD